MNRDELELLRGWATGLLSAGRGVELVAELADGELGEDVLSDPEAAGMLFELHGSHCAMSPLLDRYVLRSAGHMVLGFDRPWAARLAGDRVEIDGVVFGADSAPIVGLEDGTSYAVAGVEVKPVAGFDPSLQLGRVRRTVASSDLVPHDVVGGLLVARAARALAHQLVGVASTARSIAIRHVQERQQFVRPIGAFQSVRHQLADVFIAETGARELLQISGEPADPIVETLVVKAAAGRAALLAVQAAQQVCGALGFTEEFGLHRFVRRAYALDALLGSSEDAEHDVAAHALGAGLVPAVAIAL
jgi:hypothetical protein